MKIASRTFVLIFPVFLTVSCAHAQITNPQSLILDPLPLWAQDTLYAGPFLNIDKTMESEKISRFQSVELQNDIRDDWEKDNKSNFESSYKTALAKVKAGTYESGWTPRTFASSDEYVVALDGDETLLMQWYDAGEKSEFQDITVSSDYVLNPVPGDPSKQVISKGNVKFTPGAEKFIRDLKKDPSCKGIVIYSAKADQPAIEILDKWIFSNGEPARKYIDAIFTRNHLVLGKKAWLPSKDLRILDPELKHVMIVDDNPGRILQPNLLRAQPKYDAQVHSESIQKQNTELTAYYEHLFKNAAAEIIESSKAAKRLNISFADAFLPYSYVGTRLVNARQAQDKKTSRSASMDFVRLHPTIQDATFRTK